MGQARDRQRARQSATQKLISKHPFCCFCGGLVPSTTTDHRPPTILFPNQHRPQGLEFPACLKCNNGASSDDSVLALVGRLCGSNHPDRKRPDAHYHRVIKAVEISNPGLAGQLFSGRKWKEVRGVLQQVGQFRFDNPTLEMSICRSSARLAVAMYFEEYKRPAPAETKINSYWTHKQRNGSDKVQELISRMPYKAVLRQGQKWDTEGIFFARYHYNASVFTMITIVYGTLALFSTIHEPGSIGEINNWKHLWKIEAEKGLVLQERGLEIPLISNSPPSSAPR